VLAQSTSPSDHAIMELRLTLPSISPTTRRPRRLWEKTNWDKHDEIILESLKNPTQPKSALEVAMLTASIAEILQKAINLAVPSIIPKG
jgi:hypothetical protein